MRFNPHTCELSKASIDSVNGLFPLCNSDHFFSRLIDSFPTALIESWIFLLPIEFGQLVKANATGGENEIRQFGLRILMGKRLPIRMKLISGVIGQCGNGDNCIFVVRAPFEYEQSIIGGST